MKNVKLSTKIVIATIVLVLLVVILDYFNIPTKIGFQINNFNFNVLHILSSAITTIGIFVCTYFLIERKRLDRQNNQLLIARDLLSRVYDECERNVKQLDDNSLRIYIQRSLVITDRDRTINEYKTTPFINDKHITRFGEEGVLPYFLIQRYFRVKNNYMLYIDWIFQSQTPYATISRMKERLRIQFRKAREELATNKQSLYSDEEKLLFDFNKAEDAKSEKE